MNQINQFGVQPRWKWGYANAGDFSESYTPLTLNGLTIRGGGFAINPGQLRLAATGGMTRRIGAASNEGGFDREIYAGRIGVGRESRSSFDILFVRVRDIPSKFQAVLPDSIDPPDSTQIGTRIEYTETPQENLVVGSAATLKLFSDALVVSTEASGAAYTRDMNSPELDNDKVPSFVSKLFTPRLSSSADFAYSAGIQLRLARMTLKTGTRYIGPGYTSLGVASLLTDLREFSWGADIRRSNWSTTAAVTRQNDNLLGSKLHTTVRYTYVGNLSVRPTQSWQLSFLGNLLTLRNHAVSDTALVSFTTLSAGTNQIVMFGGNKLVQAIGMNYLFTRSSDDNIFRAANRFQSHTVSANANMTMGRNVWLIPMISLVTSRQGSQKWGTLETYSLTPQWRTLNNRLFVSSGIGFTKSSSSTSLLTDIAANYRISTKISLTASLRRIGFQGDGQQGADYGEYVAIIKLTQRL